MEKDGKSLPGSGHDRETPPPRRLLLSPEVATGLSRGARLEARISAQL